MDEPIKPRYYNLWAALKKVTLVVVIVFILEFRILDNLWIFIPLAVWLAFPFFFDLSKHFQIFKDFQTYEELYQNYEFHLAEKHKEQKESQKSLLVTNSKVNENIASYLAEKKLKKLRSKWWQFWV